MSKATEAVDRAFYELTIAQRNQAWAAEERLEKEKQDLLDYIAVLEERLGIEKV